MSSGAPASSRIVVPVRSKATAPGARTDDALSEASTAANTALRAKSTAAPRHPRRPQFARAMYAQPAKGVAANDENVAAPGIGEKRPLNKTAVLSAASAAAPAPEDGARGSIAAIAAARRSVLGERSTNGAGEPAARALLAARSARTEPKTAVAPVPAPPVDKENVAPRQATAPAKAVEPRATEEPRDWDDLDAEDAGDPLMVSDYVSDIFDYMRTLEPAITPRTDYMAIQKELNWHSRSVLVDWLVEVQWKLKLLPETLFLSVNIIDRFLARRSVALMKLQLVGMAATLLASKYEEVLSPSIANFVYLADNAYDEAELLKAERYMLHVLNFSLAYPSPLVFLRRISKAEAYDVRSRTIAKYLMEVCLLDSRFVACPPSMLAAVSVAFAREMLRSGSWTPNLRHYSGGYSEADIKPWLDLLVENLKKPIAFESVYKKYALRKLMRASVVVEEYMKRTHNVPAHVSRSTGPSVFDPEPKTDS